MSLDHRLSPWFSRYAWAFCAYLVAVILFGAWVRITHSGAGCGSHWPTCNGEVVPLSPSIETMIEYSHRLTSGLLGIFALVLVAGAARIFGSGRVTRMAAVTTMFIVFEALIGAGLVLRELVADDDSLARAVVVAVHLVNTLALTGAAALTGWWSSDMRPLERRHGAIMWLPVIGLATIILTSMTGAVTALGDTLFPVDTNSGIGLLDRVQGDLSAAKHFLVRLRIVHPIVAIVSAGVLVGISHWIREHTQDPRTRRLAMALRHAVAVEVGIGIVNIGLAAPGWLQIVHLLVAQLVWVAAVLTTVSAWSRPFRP